ncbi:lipopolysaccharide assembly LapA domain-containing protein [Enterococcus sp. UD-01]|uniref:LapA family protein n=1 Tax=Enterococcus sp. UD-01 TaxID=3373911 RepID=UPI0038328DA8
MKNQGRVIFGLVLVLIIVLFAVLNNQTVPVNFGFTKVSGPLILIILGSAILGALIGLLTSTTTMWKQKKQVKELEKQLDAYQNETDKIVAEEVEKVKRQYENQLLEAKALSETTSQEPVGSRIDRFTKPRNSEEER